MKNRKLMIGLAMIGILMLSVVTAAHAATVGARTVTEIGSFTALDVDGISHDDLTLSGVNRNFTGGSLSYVTLSGVYPFATSVTALATYGVPTTLENLDSTTGFFFNFRNKTSSIKILIIY